jgi:hypothetical protein
MNEQERKEAAVLEANRAVKPLRTAMAHARFSLAQAKADMKHMRVEAIKLWNETYSAALKERETSPRDV